MSWFNQSSLTSFAKTALSTAQKGIDKVLDIQEEEDGSSSASSGTAARSAQRTNPSSSSKKKSASSAAGVPPESETGKNAAGTPPSRSSSRTYEEDDTFFSAFLTNSNESSGATKSTKTSAKKQLPRKTDEEVKPLPSAKSRNAKSKSKVLQPDSDDSDEKGDDRKVVKPAKKLGLKKAENKDVKNEPVSQPLQVCSETPTEVGPVETRTVETSIVGEANVGQRIPGDEMQEPKLPVSAIDNEITKSTESFTLVKSEDNKTVDEEGDAPKTDTDALGCSFESSNSTSTGTVEAEETLVQPEEEVKSVQARRKSSDMDTKSEHSENTDERTSTKSDSDFVVINELTASEQSSLYLYDTRESPENESPKHYSSSSNGKRSPTDSDFSIISEGRFHDMHDSIHAGSQSQDVGNLVEQASIALSHRASPSYSADVESEDQDDKITPPSSTDERTRSSSEDGNVIREEHNSTPTPNEKECQESLPQDVVPEENTPRPEKETYVDAVPTQETIQQAVAEESGPNDAVQPQKLLKKLAEMAEVLEAREGQILHLSQQNGDLTEAVTILRNQLRQSEEARESETTDLNQLTDEFAQRIGSMEKKLQTANKERDQFKKEVQRLQKALTDAEKNDDMSKLLSEKDEQITELMAEGEKLSKQQLQNSNIIKKLRAKEKETDKLLKTQKEELEKSEARIKHLEEVLDGKEEMEKKQRDAIKTLNGAVERQEKDLTSLRGELDDAREKVRSTQHALDGSYKEIAELHRNIAAKDSKVQETALSAEMNAREELKLALDRSQLEARRQHEGLLLQVNDLQMSLKRADQQSARKEESFRQEIADLQQRLQEAEDRNQELSQSVTATTRPLLRQIENLQSTFNVQSSSWEQVERNLTERLADAQMQLAASTEKERGATEGALEASTKIAALESQLAMVRQEKSKLGALLEVERAKVESLEESKVRDLSQMENQHQTLIKALEEAQNEKVLLEKQLKLEKMKVEMERKKLSLAQEALDEKEKRLQQEENTGSRSPVSSSSTSGHNEVRPIILSNPSTPSQGDILERTMSWSGMSSSVYDSVVSGSAASIVESLQSQLKQREGEITQLQGEIVQLERTRASMAEEIVKLTNQTERLEDEVSTLPDMRIRIKDLEHRYNAVLQMYGEKAEQVEELKLDLQDVKEMYRQQIEDLIRGSM